MIQKDKEGEYFIVEEVRVGMLRFFVKLWAVLIPRQVLYMAYFAGLLLFYLLAFGVTLNMQDMYIFLFGLSSITTSLFEILKIRQMMPH